MMIGKVEDRVTGVHAKPAVVENGSCVFRCVLKSFVNGLFCVFVEFTSNISSCSLTMPTAPVNGQAIKIVFGNNTSTTLSHVAGGGQTLLGARTAGNAVAGGEWIYYTTKNTWYKST